MHPAGLVRCYVNSAQTFSTQSPTTRPELESTAPVVASTTTRADHA